MYKNKKAQLTLFIIIAVVIVVAVILTLYFLGAIKISPSLTEKNEVELSFINCVDYKVKEAVATAELQGGYFELPGFDAGSSAFPFSNYLNFLTLDIPYWSYVSGNGMQKVQQPSLGKIESQFEDYIEREILECTDFKELAEKYIKITKGELADVRVSIKSDYIETIVTMPITVRSNDNIQTITEHKIKTNTQFGALFETASEIFKNQNERTILEDYSLDVLNNYAPTNGFEISCAPKIWSKTQVQEDLKTALQENTASLKIKGTSYSLKDPDNKYFIINLDKPIEGKVNNVNFLYQKVWPSKIDMWPTNGNILRADPLGSQEGLGILGFCFVPYHFVYDMRFPVLIQITSGTEMFQFPIIVIIDKMVARKATLNETIPESFDLCNTVGQEGTVYTSYNSRAVEADISFRCLSSVCELGSTQGQGTKASLTTNFPKCVNGIIVAKATNFKDSEAIVSSNEAFTVDIFMKKAYELSLEIPLKNDEKAMISLISKDTNVIETIFYPQQNMINLSEGLYNIKVQVYKQGKLTLSSQETEQCIKIPSVFGIFGTTEECYNITVPSNVFTEIPVGGGASDISFTKSELLSSRKIKIYAETLNTPQTLDEISNVYGLISINELSIALI